jgi:hypothetical protein
VSKSHNEEPKSKAPPLQLVKLVKPSPNIRLGGKLPTEDMGPDNYLVDCGSAWLKPMSKYTQEHDAIIQFRVADGKYGGVGLRMWIDKAIDEAGEVSSIGKYARYCEIALGRPLKESDPITRPGEIFSGHRFIVFVGYRKSRDAGGKGGPNRDEWAMIRKPDDYLRVHDIISREDW